MRRLCAVVRIFLAVLREIFDESAYSRFLEQSKMTSSTASYAAFCREREFDHQRRPRCC